MSRRTYRRRTLFLRRDAARFLDVGLGLELLLTVRAREGEFFVVRRFHVKPHVRHFGEVFIA